MTEFKHTPDSLADQLDHTLPAGGSANPVSDPDPLVDAALYVASAPRPGLSADAKARIQSQILQQARQQRAPLRPQFGSIMRWALVACVVLLVLLIPTAQVTLASVPGEPLYPVKLTIEQLETSFANSPSARASLNLTHAERRTQEAQTLLARGQFDPTLIPAAYENMADAAAIIRTEADFDPGLRLKLQSQTAALVAAIDSLLISATQSDQPLAATVTPWLGEIIATQNSGGLLLPATSTPVPPVTTTPSATIGETSTPLPTQTGIPPTTLPAVSTIPAPTSSPTVQPTEAQTINLIVTGPIEAINGSSIVIYGIEIVFDPNDPILLILRVGDNISISGSINDSGITRVVSFKPVDDTIAINPDNQSIWRDSGDCSNPPPPWAPANGWRRRCENQPSSGGNQNGGNNQNRGQGQNRGDDDDGGDGDDDD